MPSQVTIHATLVETDTPELVLGKDSAGANYLALLTERSPQRDRFLCVAISSARLAALCAGSIDLRDAFVHNENGEAFAGDFRDVERRATLRLTPLAIIPEQWLPGAGFPLPDFLPSAEREYSELASEAVSRDASVGVLSLNPPESYAEPRIRSYSLAEGIRLFQDLVKEAGARARAGLKEIKAIRSDDDAFVFQVLPQFSEGSFVIHFESQPANRLDLFGNTAVGLALKKLDELTRFVDDPIAALPVLKSNSGHLVRAYQHMLRFIHESKTPMTYAWADPATPEATKRSIGIESARRTYEVLVERQDLSAVDVEFIGRFVDLGSKAEQGTWKLDVGKKRVRGTTLQGAKELLDGIVFKSQVYRVLCEERLDASVISGKPTRKYFLKARPVPAKTF